MKELTGEGRLPSRPIKAQSNIGGLEAAAPSQTDPLFFDQNGEIVQQENRLPHWQQDERTYYLTFHLADSIPRSKLDEWKTEREVWLKHHAIPLCRKDQMEFDRRFGNTAQRWLDAGQGSCLLRREGVRRIVAGALHHFNGARCLHHSFVIMPNHVHVLCSLYKNQRVSVLLRDLKDSRLGISTGASVPKGPFGRRIISIA